VIGLQLQPTGAAGDDLGTRLRRFLARPEAPGLLFLLAMLLVLSVTVDNFARVGNLHGIALQVSVVGIIALGVNLVILGGEIDISMGSLLGLAAVAAGTVAVETGSLAASLAAGITVGVVVGALVGMIVTKGRVPAIIVTLGMLYALRGTILLVTGGSSVSGIPIEARWLGRGEVLGIGVPVWLLLLVALLTWYLLQHTTWGRDVMAVGGNRRASRMSGLKMDRTRWMTFVVSGALVGLAAVVYIGRTAGVQPSAGNGLELQAIAAVVLGGTSIAGGRGSAVSPLIGALIVGVIDNAMVLQRVPGVWQSAVLGALILAAVTVDGLRGRVVRGGKG
jgi:ribose/xylose/arabinose/galactoside ABC-type transport system permease subunit